MRSQLDEYDLWLEDDDGNEDEVARYEEVMRRVDGEESETYDVNDTDEESDTASGKTELANYV